MLTGEGFYYLLRIGNISILFQKKNIYNIFEHVQFWRFIYLFILFCFCFEAGLICVALAVLQIRLAAKSGIYLSLPS